MLRMTILAARRVLPPDLMTPAKASKPRMKLSGPRGGAAAGEGLMGAAQRTEVGAGAGAPLEEHGLGLGQGHDGVHGILHRVDEAGRALRVAVAGGREFDVLRLRVPVPVGAVGVGLDAVAADVEPDGRIEGGHLAKQDVAKLVVEDGGVFVGAEVAAGDAPVADGLGDAGDELADAGFALAGPEPAVEILAGRDVGGGHGPVLGDLDVLLLEDGVALGVGDQGGAELPFQSVVGRYVGLSEIAAEREARGFPRLGSRCGRGGGGGGWW